MAKAKTRSFTDDNGNRMIFPSMIIRLDDPDARTGYDVTSHAMMINFIVPIHMDVDWLEFDDDRFPHVRTELISRGFEHGAATVYLFAGPKFDEIAAESLPVDFTGLDTALDDLRKPVDEVRE